MYKLLLVLRYLRRRRLAYFAAAGVALCVFMMLVATSVMNGFLHKVEHAAKGLHGDIVVQPLGVHGIAFYDELSELLNEAEEVEHAAPFILSYGMVRVPGQDHYRQTVQIAGIRLPERAKVSNFEKGLFVQADWPEPTFDPPAEAMLAALAAQDELIQAVKQREFGDVDFRDLPPEKQHLWNRIGGAEDYRDLAEDSIVRADEHRQRLAELQKRLEAQRAAGEDTRFVENRINELESYMLEPMPNHVILGLGVEGLSFRTDQGETIRVMSPGTKVTLYVFPLGQRSLTDISPNIQRFTVVDDCTTDVYSFDSETVYVPFDALQRLNNMGPVERTDGSFEPPRCSMLHVKVREKFGSRDSLERVAVKLRRMVAAFYNEHPEAEYTPVEVVTWQKKQHKLVSQIESQRTLVMIMFGILSLVSVLLVFVIFYMVVIQKTKDIGVLKAVGASSSGVAGIFLAFGAAVGLVGALVGAAMGCVFFYYINSIHDAMYEWVGYRVWSRESFWFDRIPNNIEPTVVVGIVIGAVIAGVLGALAPAIRAARMQPVEALRYE